MPSPMVGSMLVNVTMTKSSLSHSGGGAGGMAPVLRFNRWGR
jgi:hypothetical protein